MKQFIAKQLTLEHFKAAKFREVVFGEETTIKGDNATGKSTIFDSYCWLLFGKDAQGRKDYEIRPIIDGVLLRKVDCEVSGVFLLDGEELRLRRVYKEKWVKPRGKIEEEFAGNVTECYWNDTPILVTEYQARINTIINDSVFKMISIPLYFPTLDWKLQREQLFQLAGTITDNEIAAGNPEFATLLDRISGKSLVDFKRELSSRKKRLKDDLAQVQPRIDQTLRLMPQKEDYSELERQLAGLDKDIETIDKAITDKTTAMRQQYEGVQKRQSEINDLKQRRQKVLFDAQSQAREAAFTANASRRDLENNIKSTENEIATMQRSCQLSVRGIESLKEHLESKNKDIEALRKTWFEENAKQYQGDDACHSCGQVLPESMKNNARQLFADAKAKKLAEITQKGGEMGNETSQLLQEIADAEKTFETQKNDMQIKRDQLVSLSNQITQFPVVGQSDVKPEEINEYVQLTGQIKTLESSLGPGTEPTDTTELQNRKKGFLQMRDEIKGRLSSRETIVRFQNQIAQLEVQGKDLAQQIADAEREEYTIKNFTKAKIDECERRINGLFSLVRFKLFEYTIEGNESETCIALVDGVPFPSVNTGGRVNAGLDIINALTRFYGVTAPIFIDGRESVNQLIKTESQIINLVVSKDKELIIK